MPNTPRIHVIYGHFGSGKTEFSINYAFYLKKKYQNVSLIDLDIINTYFRMRDQKTFLESRGIPVYSSSLTQGSTLDVPALDPRIIEPLLDERRQVIVDLGGDPKGSLVLRRFLPYLDNVEGLFVYNTNRPETDTAEKGYQYMRKISTTCGVTANAIVHTTHLLTHTTADMVAGGMEKAEAFAKLANIPVRYHACLASVAEELQKSERLSEEAKEKLFPMQLYFREAWMEG